MMHRVLLRGASCLLLGLVLLIGGVGCNVVGAIVNKAGGEQKAPALYKLPKTPTLVFIESYQNPDLYNNQAQQITANINDIFAAAKVGPIVSIAKLDELRTKDRSAYSKMDIPSVARAVGAKQVIYVNLVKFNTDVPIAGTQFSGQGDVRVKLYDAETGRALWPPDTSAGRQVHYESQAEEGVDPRNPSQVQDQICRHLAARIAEIFYDSVPDEPDRSGP